MTSRDPRPLTMCRVCGRLFRHTWPGGNKADCLCWAHSPANKNKGAS